MKGPRGENVVDLMEALRRSVNQEKTSKPAKKPKAARRQKEMLLPIAGKKPAKLGQRRAGLNRIEMD